jgi:uncharacterized protein (TIGR00303 family)
MLPEPHPTLADGRVRAVAHPDRIAAFLARLSGRPCFACVVASTDTAEIPSISAAGETPEKRRYTAALDSEFLVLGRPVTRPEIPRNPLGPPSPVVITRAGLGLAGIEPLIVDAGCRVPPQVSRLVLGGHPGRCITTGSALEWSARLGECARQAGRLLASLAPWVVLAESVPGGTTTAQALLEALGVPARGRVSSSLPGGNHGLKAQVVAEGLRAAGLARDAGALRAAAAVGDPMQPAVALMALEASRHGPVVLGGGTQMAAVAALALRLWEEGEPGEPDNLGIATTRWVAEDPSADLAGLLAELPHPVPAVAAGLNFSGSSVLDLRRYEEGLVKEGVGAGAAALAAFLVRDVSAAALLARIEQITRGLGAL